MSSRPLLLGAVAYDPKVVTIWAGFRAWFRRNDVALDFVLYSNYERQVEDLLDGRIDLAWNSPLAWIRARRLADTRGTGVCAVAMRDTDRDLRSVIVVRTDERITELAGLRGRTVGTGAIDSPQATLLPLSLLREAGLGPERDVRLRCFDTGVGLHGDHIGGERAAALALWAGTVDAACMVDSNVLLFAREGTLPAGSVRVLAQTKPYDHCNLTAGPSADADQLDAFVRVLLDMSYADADLRPLLDLEGLTRWLPGRTGGYVALEKAVCDSGFYTERGDIDVGDYHYRP